MGKNIALGMVMLAKLCFVILRLSQHEMILTEDEMNQSGSIL
jgi:hypothetical protein